MTTKNLDELDQITNPSNSARLLIRQNSLGVEEDSKILYTDLVKSLVKTSTVGVNSGQIPPLVNASNSGAALPSVSGEFLTNLDDAIVDASSSARGLVLLSNATTSNSGVGQGVAATPSAVKGVNDRITSELNNRPVLNGSAVYTGHKSYHSGSITLTSNPLNLDHTDFTMINGDFLHQANSNSNSFITEATFIKLGATVTGGISGAITLNHNTFINGTLGLKTGSNNPLYITTENDSNGAPHLALNGSKVLTEDSLDVSGKDFTMSEGNFLHSNTGLLSNVTFKTEARIVDIGSTAADGSGGGINLHSDVSITKEGGSLSLKSSSNSTKYLECKDDASGSGSHLAISGKRILTEDLSNEFNCGGAGGIIVEGSPSGAGTIRFVFHINLEDGVTSPTLTINNSGVYSIDNNIDDLGIGVSGVGRTDFNMSSTTLASRLTIISSRSNRRYLVVDYDTTGQMNGESALNQEEKYYLTGENVNSIITVIDSGA